MESVWEGPIALDGRRAVRSRDEHFRELFEQYYLPVLRFFARRGFPAEEAADLAQETFTRAYEKLETLSAPAKARHWLFAVASNVRRNELRRRAALIRSGEEIPFDDNLEKAGGRAGYRAHPGRDDEETPLEELLTDERRELLHSALDQLPPRMRQVVILRVTQDLSYREIAVIQQVSVDTIKAQMLQARQKLRDLLDEHFSDIDF